MPFSSGLCSIHDHVSKYGGWVRRRPCRLFVPIIIASVQGWPRTIPQYMNLWQLKLYSVDIRSCQRSTAAASLGPRSDTG